MRNIRMQVRKIQQLENKASEKAGQRFLLIDERKLFGSAKKRAEYIGGFANQLLIDIMPEMVAASKLGEGLMEQVGKI
ncbi:hypothetical protein CMI37_30920 [Candidatus Pacearchaeota archaeon]|nr:hypothetical protein [Candidatus Pacearchaeota archaeon]